MKSSGDAWIRSPFATSCELGSGAAILDGRSNLYYTLNATGMTLWDMLPSTTADIVMRLVAEFGADRSVVERDVGAVLEQLRASNLVMAADVDRNDLPRPA